MRAEEEGVDGRDSKKAGIEGYKRKLEGGSRVQQGSKKRESDKWWVKEGEKEV